MKKIVLFRPKSTPRHDYIGVPLSLLAIASPLEKKYEIIIVDALIDDNYKETVMNSIDRAICLGITSMTGYQIHEALEVAKAVKEKYPSIPIVWGGYHCTILPEQTLRSKYVDIVVRGQGVRSFKEIVEHLENNLPLEEIRGISFKKDDKIIHNPERQFEDINNFPPFNYDLVDVKKYISETEFGSRALNYISTCGCPFNCRFCAEYTVNKGRWSGLKAKRVVDEIEKLVKEHNLDSIIFNDNNFFVNEDRVKKICSGIIEKKLNIKWGGANGRAEQMRRFDKSTWQVIKDSGCYSILIGAESGSEEVLKLINKRSTVEDTIKFTEVCKEYGIKVIFSFMLGFPHDETFKENIDSEFKKTLNLINKINGIYENVNFMWFIYTPYPGTPLYESSIKNGFKEPKSLEKWSNFNLLEKTTPWVNNKYVNIMKQLNTFIFPCISNSYMRTLGYVKKRFKLLKKLLSIPLKIIHSTALFRLKNKFFSLPIEYELIKFGRTIGVLEK